MISKQLEDFGPRERFAQLLLGVLSMSRRVAAVAEIPRADGRRAPTHALADFFLGAISIGRTVGAIVSCDAESAPRHGAAAVAPVQVSQPATVLPDLMR